jgi:hypothetical protein
LYLVSWLQVGESLSTSKVVIRRGATLYHTLDTVEEWNALDAGKAESIPRVSLGEFSSGLVSRLQDLSNEESV